MINLEACQEAMHNEIAQKNVSWKERLVSTLYDQNNWRELLQVMAEHPNLSLKNNASILGYRVAHDIHDTQELLSYEQIKEMGGHVQRGTKTIALSRPKLDAEGNRDGFETVFRFPAVVCENLPKERYHGRPFHFNPANPESLDILANAFKGVEITDPVVDWIVSERYNLHEENHRLPAIPAAITEIEDVIERLSAVQSQIHELCLTIDQSIKYQKHPEWHEDETITPIQDAVLQEHNNTNQTQRQSGQYTEEELREIMHVTGTLPDDLADAPDVEETVVDTIKDVASGLVTSQAIAATKIDENTNITSPSAADVMASVHKAHEARNKAAQEQIVAQSMNPSIANQQHM